VGDLSFKTEGALYTENPSFNNACYRVAYRQELQPKKTAVQLIYRYTPHQFLGPGRISSQADEYGEVRTTSHVWRAELQRHVTDRLSMTFISRYGLRFYDEPFTERDTRFWSIGQQVDFVLRPWSTISVAYLYERGLAAGCDDPQTDLDMSYYLDYASLGVRFELAKPLWLNLGYIYRFQGLDQRSYRRHRTWPARCDSPGDGGDSVCGFGCAAAEAWISADPATLDARVEKLLLLDGHLWGGVSILIVSIGRARR
jgi:hypothetical protein